MNPHKKFSTPASVLLFLIALVTFSCLTAFIAVRRSSKSVYKCDYCENKEARDLSDSLDVLLNQVKQSFGKNAINLSLGVVKDGHVF